MSSFPNLLSVAGAELYDEIARSLKPWHLARVDSDIRQLRSKLSDGMLRKHYLVPLLNDGISAVAELFAVARASNCANSIDPHAPGPGGKNFDAKLTVGNQRFGIEVKHQSDDFPFRDNSYEVPGAGTMHVGERPGVDPKFTNTLPPPGATRSVPGSQTWRDALLEAASQIPRDLPGIIAISVAAFGENSFEPDIVAALLGDPFVEERQLPDGSVVFTDARHDNGVFRLPAFEHIAGVWFFKLHPQHQSAGSSDPSALCVWARGSKNPVSVQLANLPEAVWYALLNVKGFTSVAT